MKVGQYEGIEVTQHEVNWENPAFGVLSRLTPLIRRPETDSMHVLLIAYLLTAPEQFGTLYANPLYTLRAASPTPGFFHAARQSYFAWLRAYKRALAPSCLRRDQKAAKLFHPLLAQLLFQGIMVAAGEHLRPDAWLNRVRAPPLDQSLVGETFSRLTVIERLAGGKWRCRCECGQEHIAHGRHLRSGRTKSCGCLWKELDQRTKERKARRAWLKS